MDLTLIIDKLVPGADYRRADDLATLTETWVDPRPIPSEEEINAAWAEIEVARIAIDTRATTRTALRTQWDGLPAWINGPYRPLFDAANRLLDEGSDEAAFEMIDAVEPTAKILNDPKAYPELGGATRAQYFAAVKAQFAAAIQSLKT